VPILDEDRRQVGLTLVLADVTDFWRLDKMKSGLLSLVSHELKTPLTSMRMVLPLVLEEKLGPLTSRQRDLLSAAREDADRLHLIVENLLDMGRIESGKALLDVRPAEALDLVRRSLEPLRPVFEERGVDLRFDLPAPAPPASDAEPLLVKADATRIGHVFRNLLGNALRYTPAGGVVTVEVRPGKEEVEFRVSDTGSGIPREHLPRVFEKFFRAPGQSGESGAGLGLAIVKEVVEAHEGRVSAESREGRGATFRFTLPRAAGTAQRQPGRQPGRRHEEQWQEQCEERHDDVQPGEITTGALGAGGPQ